MKKWTLYMDKSRSPHVFEIRTVRPAHPSTMLGTRIAVVNANLVDPEEVGLTLAAAADLREACEGVVSCDTAFKGERIAAYERAAEKCREVLANCRKGGT